MPWLYLTWACQKDLRFDQTISLSNCVVAAAEMVDEAVQSQYEGKSLSTRTLPRIREAAGEVMILSALFGKR
jgi:hypothetical protein